MDAMVCRVCLADNVRMHYIRDIGLQEIYESVTNTKLYTEDGRPVTVCYICRSQLQRCRTFCQMSQRAEQMFTELLDNGTEITHKAISILNPKTIPNLTVKTTTTTLYLYEDSINKTPVAVKEEYTEDKKTTLVDDIEILSEMKMVKQFQSHITEKSFTCKQCDKVFLKLDELRTHNMLVHTIEEYTSGMVTKKEPIIQQDKYSINKLVACNQCRRVFAKTSSLQKHMRIHSEVKPPSTTIKEQPVCHTCGKTFSTDFTLKVHMRIHTGEKPYACDKCNKMCSTSSDLKLHMRIHTGEKPYTCDVCYKKFSNGSALKLHMRIHTGEKPYTCDRCNKTFSIGHNLKVHMRIHTGERPYACDMCNKKLSTSSNLKGHMKTHTGVKPYACIICNKNFSRSPDLKVHMRIHTGEKPYVCVICDKKFSRGHDFKVHMRIHNGEKPFACKQCPRSFLQSAKMLKHIMTAHTEESNSEGVTINKPVIQVQDIEVK